MACLVILSDHGDEHLEHQGFGHGRTLYNELVRVLLMIKPQIVPISKERMFLLDSS